MTNFKQYDNCSSLGDDILVVFKIITDDKYKKDLIFLRKV